MSFVFGRSILLLWLLVLPLGINGKTHVKVTNTLDGNLDLTLHCKSKEDDLGVQLLHHNKTFAIKFTPKFLGGTQYFCTFRWQGACHWFDIYIQDRDYPLCRGDCDWFVKQSGPCWTSRFEEKPLCYPWNKVSCI